ncbi:MAG: hypothetical protein F6K07_32725, partial [Okeania sp. SIO1H5]|uniref:hypothetical protein n=1 Tax=Okeania sp. SIO1H5 TaxID=2607777 RepID=UPI0013BBFEBA
QSESWDTNIPYIRHYSEYERDKSIAAWLPTRNFAFAWRSTVIGKGTSNTAPLLITRPNKNRMWDDWSIFEKGQSVPITVVDNNRKLGHDRLDICYGDEVIESFSPTITGLYRTTWENPEPGFHAILGVAYKQGVPVGVSRMAAIIVRGKVDYKGFGPEESQIAPPPKYASTQLLRWRSTGASGQTRISILPTGSLGFSASEGITFSVDGRTPALPLAE